MCTIRYIQKLQEILLHIIKLYSHDAFYYVGTPRTTKGIQFFSIHKSHNEEANLHTAKKIDDITDHIFSV